MSYMLDVFLEVILTCRVQVLFIGGELMAQPLNGLSAIIRFEKPHTRKGPMHGKQPFRSNICVW